MRNLILFDTEAREHLLPLTATRPMAELRVGAMTLREKWEFELSGGASFITKEYLAGKYPIHIAERNILISAGVLPSASLVKRILDLQLNEALIDQEELIAACLSNEQIQRLIDDVEIQQLDGLPLESDIQLQRIHRLWDIVRHNEAEIHADFLRLTKGQTSATLSSTNTVLGDHPVFIAPTAKVECATINTQNGPVYIGHHAEIMEGCRLRGPIAIMDNAVLKMDTKMYGPTVIGPGCKAGGEITRSIMMANSNKAHDGFLGDSVIGEWCNLGADSNNSNLKNNYSEVKLWDYKTGRFEPSGVQFIGLFMGDHTKCAINTMFNTGTVAGVFANIYGAGFQRNFIPDFSWGGPDAGYRTYKLKEALDTAALVMARRGVTLDDTEKAILEYIFEHTKPFRSWDKS